MKLAKILSAGARNVLFNIRGAMYSKLPLINSQTISNLHGLGFGLHIIENDLLPKKD